MSEQPAVFDNSFRKIDVEKFDPDKFDEDEALDQASAGKPAAPTLDEQEISTLINQGKCVEALKKLVEQVPSGGAKNVAARDKAVALALRAINAVKQSAAIDDAIKVLCGSAGADAGDTDELVVLLKYVYKAMEVEKTTDVLAVVLLWHERLLECGNNGDPSGNVGIIERVFCDRHRL